MSHQSTLIELRGVSKRYGSVEALRDVDLAVQTRQIVAVVGDNGAGKSTLVHVLAGLVQPDAGSIAVRGETVRLDSVAKAAELGIASAFQQPQFCENLDVSANIFLGREMRQGLSVRDDAGMYAKAREVLNTLSTPVRAGQSIASLSGGQRQTVAIARTLLNNPSLIVLDEPTASLSVTQTAEVLDYIVRLRSAERSVIMVCHDLPNVFAIADRIVVMRHGAVCAVHATADTTYEEVIAEIASIVDGPISGEVKATTVDAEGMIEEGRAIAAIHPNMVVKIPMTVEGLKAVKALHAEGIKTNVTLVFTSAQALLAARAGASYVSPFLGRLDDISMPGIDLIYDITEIFQMHNIETEIIAASVRNPIHVIDCAKAGADIATVPYKVLEQMTKHPLTDQGIAKFQADYKAVFGE